MNEPRVIDVLSGKQALKFEVSVDNQTLVWLCVGIFLAALAAGITGGMIAKKI